MVFSCVDALGDICRPGDATEGGCFVDGSGCTGDSVEFQPYKLDVSSWGHSQYVQNPFGHINSYTIKGQQNTWQMYLHGPHIRASERSAPRSMPSVYVFATFTNKIFKFENFTAPVNDGRPRALQATQKLVGHALAPSTGFVMEDMYRGIKGLLVAEGQPFWFSNFFFGSGFPKEIYKGGVQFLPTGPVEKNCTQIFPNMHSSPLHVMTGQVVNTVDCHKPTGVCFFSVWKFYDDQAPLWNRISEIISNDCLHYCFVTKAALEGKEATCIQGGVVHDEHGHIVCHKKNVGAVHGFEIGNSHKDDPSKFDLFLVFTGKARMTDGESSMMKLTMQVVLAGDRHELKVLHSVPFATDLFQQDFPNGTQRADAGGDHAWVDDSGKYIWVSCFRKERVGVHMLDYETGKVIYSVSGINTFVPNQYTYTAGIDGVGTLGQPGSWLVVATCSCHSLEVCMPTLPWTWPIPEKFWSTGVLFAIDLNSMTPELQSIQI